MNRLSSSLSLLNLPHLASRPKTVEIPASDSNPKINVEYLYSVRAIRDYTPQNELEFELFENEIYYVSEDKGNFLYIHTRDNSAFGFAPTNFLKRQKPIVSLIGFSFKGYQATAEDELTVTANAKLVISAIEDDYVYCKLFGVDKLITAEGKLPLKIVYIEGNTAILPKISDYLTPKISISRTSSQKSVSLPSPINADEEKVMSKLIAQQQRKSRSGSFVRSKSQLGSVSWSNLVTAGSRNSVYIDDKDPEFQ